MRNFGGILLLLGILGSSTPRRGSTRLEPLPEGLSVSEGLKQPAGRWEMARYGCAAVGRLRPADGDVPEGALSRAVRRVCVFCGSSPGRDPRYAEAGGAPSARELVARGIGLVFGGGSVGLMGVLADHGPRRGRERRPASSRTASPRASSPTAASPTCASCPTMHARKALMAELADGFVALPGGIGTFEELFEIATWGQLGIHRKPIGVLNVAGYYDPLVALLDHAVAEGFVSGGEPGPPDRGRRRRCACSTAWRRTSPRRRPAWITPEEA